MSNSLIKPILNSLFGKNFSYLIQVISLGVTARLFEPSAFGVIATLLILVNLFNVIGEGGIGTALISKEYITEQLRDCMFTISFLLSLILSILFFIIAPLLSKYFLVEYGSYVITILTVSIFLSMLSMIPIAIFRRDLKFLFISRIEVLAEISSIGVTFILWRVGFELEAIVSRYLTIGLIKFTILYYYSAYSTVGRPKLTYNIKSASEFLRVSGFQFLYSIVNYFSRTIDNIVVGKYFDISTLGIYEKSYQLMRYPMMLISIAISPAIQSVMSRNRNDIEKFSTIHKNIEIKLLVYGGAVSIVFSIMSKQIVALILGDGWEAVSELLSIFSIAIPFLMCQGISGGFFQALERTDILFVTGVISITLNLIAITLSIYQGDLNILAGYLSISFIFTYIITHLIFFIFLYKCFDLKHSIKLFFLSVALIAFHMLLTPIL